MVEKTGVPCENHYLTPSHRQLSHMLRKGCLVAQTPMDIMSNCKASTLLTHVACELKLRSVERPSMYLCTGNLVAIGRAVVYYARVAHAFSARIRCQHCKWPPCIGDLLT